MPLVLFNKPFRVLSQFTSDADKQTLARYIDIPKVYAAGRLDYDSEGLLLLTDSGRLKSAIAQPRSRVAKHYWVQVEGIAEPAQLAQLRDGVMLKDGPARAHRAMAIETPEGLWPRMPPIRSRKTVPDSWIDIAISEGRNRQVRRMTAAVGLPTLRLVRHQVGPWRIDELQPGAFRQIPVDRALAELGR